MLGVFCGAVFYHSSHRQFGTHLMFPVGAVFFVAIAVSIIEVRVTPLRCAVCAVFVLLCCVAWRVAYLSLIHI